MSVKLPVIKPVYSEQDSKSNFDNLRSWFKGLLDEGGVFSARDLIATGLVNSSLVPLDSAVNDRTTPPAVENFTVTGAFRTIMLTWDKAAMNPAKLAYYEIWRSQTNDMGTASMVGQTAATLYVDAPSNASLAQTYYYWVRVISTANVAGPFNDTAGTSGATANDPVYLMEVLAAELDNVTPSASVPDLVYAVSRFAIKNVSAGVTKYPFIVDATLGVIIDVALIKDATITSAKIETLAADKIYAASGTIADVIIGTADITSAMIDTLDVGKLTGTTITGKTLQTASGTGQRVVISQADNTMRFYNASNVNVITVSGDTASPFAVNADGYTAGVSVSGDAAFYAGSFNNTNTDVSWGLIGQCATGRGVEGNGSTYDFYASGSGTNYGPFTGAHDGLIDKTDVATPGDIVIDGAVLARANLSNCITLVALSDSPMDKRVIGVFVGRADLVANNTPSALMDKTFAVNVPIDSVYGFQQAYDLVQINSLGEGQVNVCKDGGNIEAGDYICSSDRPGKGMKQPDDLLHNYTVAKAREDCIWSEGEDDIRMIACTYHCG